MDIIVNHFENEPTIPVCSSKLLLLLFSMIFVVVVIYLLMYVDEMNPEGAKMQTFCTLINVVKPKVFVRIQRVFQRHTKMCQ